MNYISRFSNFIIIPMIFFVFAFFGIVFSSVSIAGGLPEDKTPVEPEPVQEPEPVPVEPEPVPVEPEPVPVEPEPVPVEPEPEPVSLEPAPKTQEDSWNKSGFTIGFSGTSNIISEQSLSTNSFTFKDVKYDGLDAGVTFKDAYSLGVTMGYKFETGLRIEAEGGYLSSCFDDMDVDAPGTLQVLEGVDASSSGSDATGKVDVNGDFTGLSLMANAYFDFDRGGKIAPYVGTGLGVSRFSAKMECNARVGCPATIVDDKDNVLTYQIGGGVGVKVAKLGTSDLVFSFGYRYFAAVQDLEFEDSTIGIPLKAEVGGHQFGGGIRLVF